MPELPEVEAVVRELRPRLVGRRLGASVVRWTPTLGGLSARAFGRAIDGALVQAVERRAKWIVIDLGRERAGAGSVCVHLRMTGRLQVDPKDEPPGRWERARVALDDGRTLRFIDPRKFGRVCFVRDRATLLGELGPEPLGEEFTLSWFTHALRAHRRLLKPLLLDQTLLAGLGNIYVDEALHRAGLHPLARSERLGPARVSALRDAIRAVLAAAIERDGSGVEIFARTPEGRPGSDGERFHVYGRAGQPCRRCGTPIRRSLVGQRSTFICPRCQPGKRL